MLAAAQTALAQPASAQPAPAQAAYAQPGQAGALAEVAARVAPETVAHAAQRIDSRLRRAKEDVDVLLSIDELEALAGDIDALDAKTIMLFGARRERWQSARTRAGGALRAWVVAVRSRDARDARAALADTRAAWDRMKAEYPDEALQVLPGLWTCPMHPEVMAPDAGACPVCGMPLDPIYETQPGLSRDPIIRAEIVADAPLVVGKRADLRIRLLFTKDGAPVSLDDLEEAHTRKIHLLIIDLSETDYHHEHPEPVAPGEYAFGFTPSRPGPYRVWADLKPVATRVQQYAVADIAAENPWAEPAGEEPENRTAEIDGYRFTLEFEKPSIQALDTVRGKVRVVDAHGLPCDRLQVVMGAFGHFVGFRSYSSVLHMHPLGAALVDPAALGGPNLDFYFRSPEPGLIRLFTQVRIEDRELFPRFVVRVEPRPRLIAQ